MAQEGQNGGGPGEVVPNRRNVLIEVFSLYLGTLLAIKAIIYFQAAFSLPEWVLVLVPTLFVYVPILWLEHKKIDPGDFGLRLERFGPAIRINLILAVSVLLPFAVGNHFYQRIFFGRVPTGHFPANFWMEVVVYHLLFVAFPEEFFYRGYVQSRLNQIFPRKYRLWGVSFGGALFLTAIMFTVGHSVVVLRWWHFSILFPALVFGMIRERSGNVVASALFHATCNIVMVTLDTYYGVISP